MTEAEMTEKTGTEITEGTDPTQRNEATENKRLVSSVAPLLCVRSVPSLIFVPVPSVSSARLH